MKRKKKKKKKKVTEASYYSQMITITKNHLNSKNSTNYVKKVQKVGKRLSENTLIKILNAYQDTFIGVKLVFFGKKFEEIKIGV